MLSVIAAAALSLDIYAVENANHVSKSLTVNIGDGALLYLLREGILSVRPAEQMLHFV